MKKIFKYGLSVESEFKIEMPKGAKILSVQLQHGQPVLWAEVETDNEPEKRRFSVIGTGHEIKVEPREFLGTFQLSEGTFIGHLFEIL